MSLTQEISEIDLRAKKIFFFIYFCHYIVFLIEIFIPCKIVQYSQLYFRIFTGPIHRRMLYFLQRRGSTYNGVYVTFLMNVAVNREGLTRFFPHME
jgi:hypothetical protein